MLAGLGKAALARCGYGSCIPAVRGLAGNPFIVRQPCHQLIQVTEVIAVCVSVCVSDR